MFVVVFVNVLFLGIIADASHIIVQQCGNFRPQQWVEVDKMLGKWFVTEVVFHRNEESRPVDYHEQCPIIFLSEILQDGLLTKPDTLEADSYNNQEYKSNTYGVLNSIQVMMAGPALEDAVEYLNSSSNDYKCCVVFEPMTSKHCSVADNKLGQQNALLVKTGFK